MSKQRRRALYSGRVQGVGFRWRCMRALAGAPVTGFVRNLADGRVELVIEGHAEELDAALDAVRGALASHIQHEAATALPATGEFSSLEIRR